MKPATLLLISLLGLGACATERREEPAAPKPVLFSLTGKPFFKNAVSEATGRRLDSAVQAARNALRADSTETNFIWFGRRLAYRNDHDSAIAIFEMGLQKFPRSFRLLRHRGHRYITLRKFDAAIADFSQAAALMQGEPLELEPDGVPNRLNTPLSSTQFNVWYHLGLAHYLKGEYDAAEQAYRECLKVSINDDLMTATVDWLYMTLRRHGKAEAAATELARIKEGMTIIENESYYRRLRMYQGKLKPEEVLVVDPADPDADLSLATQGYGVGNWYYYNGDTARAFDIYRQVVGGKYFTAFGFIASEADLAATQPAAGPSK